MLTLDTSFLTLVTDLTNVKSPFQDKHAYQTFLEMYIKHS